MDNFTFCCFNSDCIDIFKNQTKPLVRLAKAAERFGKGDYVNDFRASGSQEIRKAALNLIEWQKN